MYKLEKEKTASTPYILIDEENNYLKISGESFPENVTEFYKDVAAWLDNYMKTDFPSFTADFELIYFNSSTSKFLTNILELLDTVASEGKKITVNWITNPENDIITECGEEFSEDFINLEFNIVYS